MKNTLEVNVYHAKQVTAGDMPMAPSLNGLTPANTLYLQIGDISCALEIYDFELFNWLKKLYQEYETVQPPDITVQLETTSKLNIGKLQNVILKSKIKQREGKYFEATHGILSGRLDPASHLIEIKAEKNLGNPELKVNHLNRLLTMAYYTACKLKYGDRPPAMFVHTCGIIRHGQALLFSGPSEVGKTTIARFCGEQDGEVINDEMVLVCRPGRNMEQVSVRGTPILGTFPPSRRLTAPLRCIFLLKQGDKTQAHTLKKTEAYTRLLRQIISPACLGQKDRKSIYSMMADFSAEIVQSLPTYELEFQLDKEAIWQTVADIENILSEKERQ